MMKECSICNTKFEGNSCPNCGHQILSQEKQAKDSETAKVLAIISICFTATSFFDLILTRTGMFFILAIPSLILAIIAKVKDKKHKALPIIALIISIFWTVLLIALLAIVLIFISALALSCASYTS